MHSIITKKWRGRLPVRVVNVGNVPIGGNYQIRIQSMTNASTLDINDTVVQCLKMIESGVDLVRISVPNIKSAENLSEIKKQIRLAGYKTPIIADIHFNPKIAIVAAKIVEKIRINPGNYYFSGYNNAKEISNNSKELEEIYEKISPLLLVCKDYGTAIRIGTNHGSLSPRVIEKYGNTSEGIVQATLEYLKIFEDQGFYNTVISLKASNPLIMIDAYRKMAEIMYSRNISYPMHLGVTEAGIGDEGRINSATGICALLNDGIGDTIRVSLSESPEKEIPFAKKIAKEFDKSFTVINESKKSDFNEIEKFRDFERIRNNSIRKIFDDIIVIGSNKECDKNSEKDNKKNKPDFLFSESLFENNSDRKLIVPISIWQKNYNNTFPLIDIKEIDKIKKENLYNVSFIFINAEITEISKDIIKSVSALKNSSIILRISKRDSVYSILEAIRFINSYKMPVIIKFEIGSNDWEEIIVQASNIPGYFLAENLINGLWVNINNDFFNKKGSELAFYLLQSFGLRITSNRYISCPTCARTSFDLPKIVNELKSKMKGESGLKIAIMGCVVNGPGEMADADYGLIGAGEGKMHIYKKKDVIKKNVQQENAVKELVKIIQNKFI